MLNINLAPSTRMDRHIEVAGIECIVAPLTSGAITISGFKEMFWRGCQSPILANAITAWAITEVIEDGLSRFKDKPAQTVKQLQIGTSALLVDCPGETDTDSDNAEGLNETLRAMPVPDFLDGLFQDPADAEDMTVDTRDLRWEAAISFEFEFLAGRHTLNLVVHNMVIPFALLDQPIDKIASRIVTGAIMHIRDEVTTIAENYADTFTACESELEAMPGLENCPKQSETPSGLINP